MATQNKKNSNKKNSNKKKNNAENFGLEDIIAQNSNAEKTFESLLVRSYDMEEELMKCQTAADQGYSVATKKYEEISINLLKAEHKLKKAEEDQNQLARIQATTLISKQEKEIQNIRDYIGEIRKNIDVLHERQKEFSIAVFGRKMSGKSTLMEILTHGNGKSIGKGAQRTTLDVRDYYWNGLKVTDVPGISAFGGAVDETLALEAAKSADLILFLLTSDAPQADEAEKLAQLRSLGKPVLGVINVKMSFNINDDLDIEDLQDKLADTSTIETIINQFKKFSAKHNQDWSNIKFVATHLLSAYQSQDKNPKVFQISRFNEVENFILEKVRNDGRFLRIKTFADSVAVPMSNIILKIYEQAAKTLIESDIWFEKRQELEKWREKFLERSQERLDNTYKQLSQELNQAMYDFAENHYEDEKAGEHWEQTFRNLNFDKKYENLLKSLAGECERKRKELSDELTQSLSYTFKGNQSVSVEVGGTTPWGQYASLVLPNLLMFVPGIGWAARLGIGVVSWLISNIFENKQEKIRNAKNELRVKLINPSYEILDKMHDQVINTFNNEILNKGVDEFNNLLCGYQFMLARLGESQRDMANTLYQKFFDLNFELLNEAIKYKNIGYGGNVSDIARIPGEIMTVISDDYNLNPAKLSDLLGENVVFVKPKESLLDTVQMILNRNFDVDAYPLDFSKENEDAENTYAILLKESVPETNFKLAQQMAAFPIIKKYYSAPLHIR